MEVRADFRNYSNSVPFHLTMILIFFSLGSDTAWGQGGGRSASHGARDVVSVLAVTREPTALHVSIGGLSQEFTTHHQHGHLTFLEVPFDGRVGPVQLYMSGKSVTGPGIRNEVPPCGHNTYNCTAVHL